MRLLRPTLAAALLALVAGPADAAFLKADYQLNGSFADSSGNGSPALTSGGGSLGATGYMFAAGQGLSVGNVLSNPGDYSIEMRFHFDTVTGFRKILDFKNLTADTGLYVLNTSLNFYNVVTSPGGLINAGQNVDVLLTRDAATNTVTGYVNGVQALSFNDSGNLAVFSGPNNIIQFFRDDTIQNSEQSAGFVDQIQIYDGVLTPTPAPPAFVLAGLGLVSLAGYGRFRRAAAPANPA